MLDDIELRVFSRIKNKCPISILSDFPDITFTTSDKVPQEPKFPNIYIHQMETTEIAEDLERTTINAIDCTFQINVTVDTTQSDARRVMTEVVLNTMKTMRFHVVTMPFFQSTANNTVLMIARFSRTIASGDVL